MKSRLSLLFVVLVLVVAACGGASTEESTTTSGVAVEATTTTQAPATTSTQPPATTTTSTTGAVGGEGAIPDPAGGATLLPYADENITAGDVFIYWYRETGGGNFLALYTGPGIAGSQGQALCPGNSVLVTPDYLNVSNTPVEEGSCTDFPTPSASVQICSSGVWIYRTEIPSDTQGNLIGSLEWNAGDGTIKGLTSGFSSSEEIGEFEFGLGTYTLWNGFTSDGAAQITCEAPTS